MCLPDRFIPHGSSSEQYEDAGLHARHIIEEVFLALGKDLQSLPFKARA
jgi:deoxyxylulose-5-phosphate synthase